MYSILFGVEARVNAPTYWEPPRALETHPAPNCPKQAGKGTPRRAARPLRRPWGPTEKVVPHLALSRRMLSVVRVMVTVTGVSTSPEDR